jgi:pyruvate ferredoxin oxidoreductase alpha subunit
VNSVLKKAGLDFPCSNYIGGLGGKDISAAEIRGIFEKLEAAGGSVINFLGVPQND